nr:peptidyl-prolyl cis-trans isomerase-like 4 [Quercus suber]
MVSDKTADWLRTRMVPGKLEQALQSYYTAHNVFPMEVEWRDCSRRLPTSFRSRHITAQADHYAKTRYCAHSFIKLCKIKYYNYSPVYNVQPGFSCQSGDPIGPESRDSDGGSSIWGEPDGLTKRAKRPDSRAFKPDFSSRRKHSERGTVSMATTVSKMNSDDRYASSQFIITLGDNIEQLDGKAAIFGEVVEGFDALEKINTAFIDQTGRPLQDIRILHTLVLDDPFDDPPGLIEPPQSPLPTAEQRATVRIAHDEVLEEKDDPEQMEKIRREREARAQALTLELIGDLPFADVTPPEQILFVCKLNPVTRDEDLELIFSRFGKILSCEVIRDKKTGDSLQYAFIEFASKEDCERAYFKMQGVLIDDHRIHVDFSQSVSKLSADWRSATKSKTATSRGGFGGIDSLQKRRQYRGGDADRERGADYDYVFEKHGRRHMDRSGYDSAARRRSRSPRPQYDSESWRDNGDKRRDRHYDHRRRDLIICFSPQRLHVKNPRLRAHIDKQAESSDGKLLNPLCHQLVSCSAVANRPSTTITSPFCHNHSAAQVQLPNSTPSKQPAQAIPTQITMFDRSKVLVYHYRHNGAPVVKSGLAIISKDMLKAILASHPDLQCTTRRFARGAFSVDIRQSDVAGSFFEDSPHVHANVASVSLPLRAVFGGNGNVTVHRGGYDMATPIIMINEIDKSDRVGYHATVL